MGGGIDLFYLVSAATGFLFTLFAALTGKHGRAGGHQGHSGLRFGRVGGHHGGLAKGARAGGHGGSNRAAGRSTQESHDLASFFSPLTAAIFISALGFIGLILRAGFNVSPGLSFLTAAPGALLTAALVFYVFLKVFVGSESTSMASTTDCIGHEGEIVTRIERGRIGSVMYVDKGARFVLPARAVGDSAFDRGETVYIARVEGNTAYVARERPTLWDDEFEEAHQSDQPKPLSENQ